MSSAFWSYPARFTQLAAVWAYAVSQPIFSLLSGNPAFLVARASTKSEVVVFAILLTFGPPLAAIVLERLVSLASETAGKIVHSSLVGLFAAPVALAMLRPTNATREVAIGAALAGAALVAVACWRLRPLRLFLTVSGVLPVIAIAWFGLNTKLATEDARGANVNVPEAAPILFIVFDEFPAASLMTADGRIDSVRYPNFGRLASAATWYPRATTVGEDTTSAVPAILTGRLPRQGQLPVLTDQPRNLFTLLGERYRLHVHEEVTYLCPKRYCPRAREPFVSRLTGLLGDVRVAYLHSILPDSLADGLPDIKHRWSGFTNTERLLAADDPQDAANITKSKSSSTFVPSLTDAVVSGIRADEASHTLHFVHFASFPHYPWRFVPSGRMYANAERVKGERGDNWIDDDRFVHRALQRHLLQVGFVDKVLGQFLDRLEQTGLHDRALVVVLADHGASFQAGESRRSVNGRNIAEIARVPFFVKLPGQRRGRVDPRPVRTVDVLPTIADALGIRLGWPMDGKSLLRSRGPTSRNVVVFTDEGDAVRVGHREVDRLQAARLRQTERLFGRGNDLLYELGRARELLDEPVSAFTRRTAAGVRVAFDNEGLFSDVHPSSGLVPARITGDVKGLNLSAGGELAVAVNGRVVALTTCVCTDGAQYFDALVPETAFREGRNQVALYRIDTRFPAPRLTLLGTTGEHVLHRSGDVHD